MKDLCEHTHLTYTSGRPFCENCQTLIPLADCPACGAKDLKNIAHECKRSHPQANDPTRAYVAMYKLCKALGVHPAAGVPDHVLLEQLAEKACPACVCPRCV